MSLERVRVEFVAAHSGIDAALVSLELAILYLEEGRSSLVRDLAHQIFSVFKSQRLPRETAAALRLFFQAADAQTVTVEQVRTLLFRLERSRGAVRLIPDRPAARERHGEAGRSHGVSQ